MLTKEQKEYISEVHKLLDDMERLGVSEKVMSAFIKDRWFSFNYRPEENFKYIGGETWPNQT